SFSTLHLAVPAPVFVAVQPGGGAPAVRLSKLTVCANATPASVIPKNIVRLVIVFSCIISCCRPRPENHRNKLHYRLWSTVPPYLSPETLSLRPRTASRRPGLP